MTTSTTTKTVFLKKKRPGKSRLNALPFVATRNKVTIAHFLDVPATGGYLGGYQTGAAAAIAFLKYQRGEERGGPNNLLASIFESFAVRLIEEGGLEMLSKSCPDQTPTFSSLRGQYAGFFNKLSECLENAVKEAGSHLDRVTDNDLLKRMNAGLSFDEDAFIQSLESKQ